MTYGDIRKIPRNPPATKVKKVPIKKMGKNGINRM